MIETFDSWSTEFRFEKSSIAEKERKKIEDQFYESGMDAFEKCGYVFVESYFVLLGPLDFRVESKRGRNKDDGDVFKKLGL